MSASCSIELDIVLSRRRSSSVVRGALLQTAFQKQHLLVPSVITHSIYQVEFLAVPGNVIVRANLATPTGLSLV